MFMWYFVIYNIYSVQKAHELQVQMLETKKFPGIDVLNCRWEVQGIYEIPAGILENL